MLTSFYSVGCRKGILLAEEHLLQGAVTCLSGGQKRVVFDYQMLNLLLSSDD